LPKVSLSEDATITRLQTPFGIILRRESIDVPVEWALLRIKDSNLMFVFGEEDRKDVSNVDSRLLPTLSRVLGQEVDASTLSSLLLPIKKKTRAKKASTPKKSVKAEKAE